MFHHIAPQRVFSISGKMELAGGRGKPRLLQDPTKGSVAISGVQWRWCLITSRLANYDFVSCVPCVASGVLARSW